MKTIIETTINGYILRIAYDEEGEEVEVFEEMQSEEECFARLATRLSEVLVRHHNKYGSDNINITWDKKGRKAD